MGLDMYLEGDRFIWDYGKEEQKAAKLRFAVDEVLGGTPGKVTNIITEAAYWRKANAIHKWFVDNVQEGVDECQRSYVERSQLKILRDLCQEVINNPDSASEKLPAQSGFFFGDTDYGEWYFDDLKSTVEMLDIVLDEEKYPIVDWSFHYRASW